MDWNLTRYRLGTVLRLVLGGVWAWAAFSKLQEPRQFLRAVRAFDATPEWLSKGIAYGLPMLELIVAVLLILGLLTRIAAGISAVLFTIFLIGILQAWARGLRLDCGCFGGAGGLTDNPTYWLDILRDVSLMAVAIYLFVWPLTFGSVDGALASKHDISIPSAKRMRTKEGQARYDAMVAKARRQQRNQSGFLTASLAALTVLICVIAIGVQSGRAAIQGTLEANNATVANGVVWGSAKAPVTVDIYEDFQCPICNDFELATGEALSTLVTDGKIKIQYHTMAFLDASSKGNRYSSRAANAALCASDISVDDFHRFHAFLFGVDSQGQNNQPPENSNGMSDSSLLDYASVVGLTTTGFSGCVLAETHKALVQAITDQSSKDGITSTPTILVGGEAVKPKTGDATLSAAVLRTINDAVTKAQAAGKALAPYTISPQPSATPTDGSTTTAPAPTTAPTPSATPTS